jgi:hypothetical protein
MRGMRNIVAHDYANVELRIVWEVAGVHSFWKAEKDLPAGILPSVIKSWKEAVMNGYFV